MTSEVVNELYDRRAVVFRCSDSRASVSATMVPRPASGSYRSPARHQPIASASPAKSVSVWRGTKPLWWPDAAAAAAARRPALFAVYSTRSPLLVSALVKSSSGLQRLRLFGFALNGDAAFVRILCSLQTDNFWHCMLFAKRWWHLIMYIMS